MSPQSAADAVTCRVAVVMERLTLASRWAAEKWEAKGVVRDIAPGRKREQIIVEEQNLIHVLFSGHAIRLDRGEAEGCYLNITSPQPKVFVLWRMHGDVARPERLTVSYHEGVRWADSGENVDGVPLPAELLPWISEFVRNYYKPEPGKPRRYASNKDEGRMGRRERP